MNWRMGVLAMIAALGFPGALSAPGADLNGDGTDEIAVFSPAEGQWAARKLTRAYFGGAGDVPVPVDLKGNGTAAIATFRAADGLWAVRNVTRAYFGGAGDIPLGKGGSDPAALACPLLNLVSTRDRIVPAGAAPQVGERLDIDAGHVGMIVGSRARALLWEPLRDWLKA